MDVKLLILQYCDALLNGLLQCAESWFLRVSGSFCQPVWLVGDSPLNPSNTNIMLASLTINNHYDI